jgi:predicted adenylyl cyclase CyaB
MPVNVEVKVSVVDLVALRQRVVALATSGPEWLIQHDTFFNVPTARLKLREFANGSGELIYYERADTLGPKVSTYFRSPASDPLALRQVLAQSLGVRATVKKRRELFLVGQTRIHLDEVEGLGSFLELEVVLADGESTSDGDRIAAALMDRLGVLPADLIAHAYVDLLENARFSAP